MSLPWPPPKHIYNHPLPENYYDENGQQHLDYNPRYDFHELDMGMGPRTPFINPQLLGSSPMSPDIMGGDYQFPIPATFPSAGRSYIADDNLMDCDMNTGHNQRQVFGAWAQQSQMPNFYSTSDVHRSSRNTNCWERQTHSLPTPPSSPTSVLPVPNMSIADCGIVTSNIRSASSATSGNNTNINTRTNNANSSTTTSSNSHKPKSSSSRRSSSPKSSTSPSASSSSSRHYCTHQHCIDLATGRPTKSFSRRADLQRHHASTHDSPALFSCPRPNCSRKGDSGFTRMDHLVEHRRGYHSEHIPKRGERGQRGSATAATNTTTASSSPHSSSRSSPSGVEKRR